jgi:hypothetical protein
VLAGAAPQQAALSVGSQQLACSAVLQHWLAVGWLWSATTMIGGAAGVGWVVFRLVFMVGLLSKQLFASSDSLGWMRIKVDARR